MPDPKLKQIPPVGLGTAAWAAPYPSVPENQVIELVQFALEASNKAFFDTAPKYGLGLCEQMLGKGLRGVPRDRYYVATKAGLTMREDGVTVYYDWSRDGILKCVENSLKRLGLDYVDILHLHDPDWHREGVLETALPTLVDLRAQGVIRAIGSGVNHWEILETFSDLAEFDCFLLAGRYTLLEQGALDFLNKCQVKGIPIFLGGVYNSGILATGAIPGARYNYHQASPEILQRVRQMEAICARFGIPLRAAALQFPLAHPTVKSLVIGASSKAEFAENLGFQCQQIPVDLWANLRIEGLLSTDVPLPIDPPCP